MPDDRLGDLGEGGSARAGGPARERPTAAEQLAELDSQPSAPDQRRTPPAAARPGGRYTWVVGVAAAIAIIVVSVNSLPNAGRGFRGPKPGEPVPEFAAPSATGGLDGDANVRQRDEGTAQEGAVPACSVREPGVVKVCDAPYRHLVVTFVTPGCESQLDRVEAIRPRFPTVSFVGVVSGESRADAAALAADHDWSFPVAADADRAVFNLYRAGDCPTTTFAYRGGDAKETRLGALDEAELDAAVRDLAGGPAGGAG